MTTRMRRERVTFKRAFRLKSVDRLLPAGAYDVVTEEEMIEGLSFASYRRTATMITVPSAGPRSRSWEMISIGALELSEAQLLDASRSDGG